jgi:hypothetical protein
MLYKTEIKATDSDLFFVVPKNFVKSLQWHKGDVIDFEFMDNTLLISKI